MVTLPWISCDGITSHLVGSSNTHSHFVLGSIPARGSSNTTSHFILGILWWTSIPFQESSNTPNHLMLGILWWTSIPFQESSNTPNHLMLGVLWWISIPFQGSSNTPSHFLIQKAKWGFGRVDGLSHEYDLSWNQMRETTRTEKFTNTQCKSFKTLKLAKIFLDPGRKPRTAYGIRFGHHLPSFTRISTPALSQPP